MSSYNIATVKADGVDVFYRFAGPADAPAILLLHGFPSSSHMFRNLIPLLAQNHRVYAPDLPGFGFTTTPKDRAYTYTFNSLATTLEAFVDALALQRFTIYIFDYGAPTGLRLALARPSAVTAIITQNGNAYEEGLGEEFWKPLQSYWASDSAEERAAIGAQVLTLETTKWQYTAGAARPEAIEPEAYHLDQALLERPGNADIQLDLFRDYKNNLPLYPRFQEYFRASDVPVLAVWGKNDVIFVPAGAEAYRRDVRNFELHFVDSGHFALETNEEAFAELISKFLGKWVK